MKLKDMSTKQLKKKITRIGEILASWHKCKICGNTSTHTEHAMDGRNRNTVPVYLCDDDSCSLELSSMDCLCEDCFKEVRKKN